MGLPNAEELYSALYWLKTKILNVIFAISLN
jgi:hypothetical protein